MDPAERTGGTTRVGLCLYVLNAENDIQEWIAYHAAIGVETVMIYDNGSSDATAARALAMQSIVDVRVISWAHATGSNAQGEAYMDCVRRFGAEFDWILFLDSDEFLVSLAGQPIQALVEPFPPCGGIAFNWACFGSGGHASPPAGLTIEAFTTRAHDDFDPNRLTKMIIRPDQVQDYLNPHFFRTALPVLRVNGSPVEWTSEGYTSGVDLSGWRVNHYFVRSRAQWGAKLRRGYRDVTRSDELFDTYDRNEVRDETVLGRVPEVRALLNRVRPPTGAP